MDNGASTGAPLPGIADSQRMIHELRVHEIELELQNEELREAKAVAETALEKYTELYDFAAVGYLTLASDGTVRLSNLTAASLVGIERSRLVGRPFAGLVSAGSRPAFTSFLKAVFALRTKQSVELDLPARQHPPRTIRLEAETLSDRKECRAMMVDITHDRRMEATAAELAAIVEFSADAIIGKNLKGIVTSWNGGAERIFGYSATEMVGSPITRLIPPERLQEEVEILGRIKRGQCVEHFETVRMTKNGRKMDVSVTVSPILYADGRIAGASKVVRDISERKQAQDRLRVSEIRYRRLFETANDGVILLDPGTCKIIDANPFMTRLLGYERDQLVGKELYEIGLLKDAAASRQMFRNLKKTHEMRYEDLPLKSQRGRNQEVEVVANLYQEDGRPVIQCNIRDITVRKQAEAAQHRLDALAASSDTLKQEIVRRHAEEESLRQSENHARLLWQQSEQLQAKLRQFARQNLLAQENQRREISRALHDDISQLLVGIDLNLEVFVKAAEIDPAGIRRTVTPLRRLVGKSLRIVHRFARELRPASLDDLGLVPALLAYIEEIPKRKGRQIRFTGPDNIGPIDNDKRTVLYRVAQEALTNAARHSEASVVNVALLKNGKTVCLEIADNGKAFDVDRLASRNWNNRLGMIGMHERVEMVGGRFSITSSPGLGTTIRAEVPLGGN